MTAPGLETGRRGARERPPSRWSTGDEPASRSHRIGRHGSDRGPVLLAVAGLHGNEPAGVAAIERVLEALSGNGIALEGELVGLAGHVAALARGERFLRRDLNRMWEPSRVSRLLVDPTHDLDCPETREQRDLLSELEPRIESDEHPLFVLDLHTASAPGAPFCLVGDTRPNRRFARRFPIPLLIGLEERIEGALVGYVHRRGHVSIAIEGGQHTDPAAADRLEAALWIGLAAAGMLPDSTPEVVASRTGLAEATVGLPRYVEVRHRHALEPFDDFEMVPGYENFRRVSRGEILGHDHRGEVLAVDDGLLLLPRYQGLGDDGFFLGRRVSGIEMMLSEHCRSREFDRIVPFLPGLGRHPRDRTAIVVEPGCDLLIAQGFLDFLGYRHRAVVDDLEIATRSV